MRPLTPYIKLMRPLQWIKSAFVLAPIVFTLKWSEADAWINILIAAAVFCMIASAVYIANDWVDIEQDKKHPKKRKRPLAAGTAKPHLALTQLVALLALAVYLSMSYLPQGTIYIIGIYLFLNIAYSTFFKRFSVIDVVVLACFYVLRVMMGCLAIDVPIGGWMILTTFFLALTIGFSKRNAELQFAEFASSKANLQGYNPGLTICLLGICSAATLITYAIYAAEKQAELGSHALIYSVIFVAAGCFRFLQLVLVKGDAAEPERTIIGDGPIVLSVLCWAVTVCVALYW